MSNVYDLISAQLQDIAILSVFCLILLLLFCYHSRQMHAVLRHFPLKVLAVSLILTNCNVWCQLLICFLPEISNLKKNLRNPITIICIFQITRNVILLFVSFSSRRKSDFFSTVTQQLQIEIYSTHQIKQNDRILLKILSNLLGKSFSCTGIPF